MLSEKEIDKMVKKIENLDPDDRIGNPTGTGELNLILDCLRYVLNPTKARNPLLDY